MCILDHIYNKPNNVVQCISVFKLTKATARLYSAEYSDRNKKCKCERTKCSLTTLHAADVWWRKKKNYV